MTACAPNDRLMQTLRVHVPGATDAVLELELFNVMDQFFRRTSAWNYVTDINLVNGQLEYVIGTPVNTSVIRVMGVVHNGLTVPSALSGTGAVQSSVGVLDPSQIFPDGDVAVDPTESDMAAGLFSYAIYRPGYIQLTGFPTDASEQSPLKVISALSLARGCLECDCGDWAIDEWMWDMFFQVWLDGTLSRLYAMPSKPWASPTNALVHGRAFRNHMAYHKQEAVRGFLWNQPAWQFPRGW
jgi:hypothetical protein